MSHVESQLFERFIPFTFPVMVRFAAVFLHRYYYLPLALAVVHVGMGTLSLVPNDFKRITRYPRPLPWVRFARLWCCCRLLVR